MKIERAWEHARNTVELLPQEMLVMTGVDGLVQTYPGAPRWFKVHANYHF